MSVKEASAKQEERLYMFLLETYVFGALVPSHSPLIKGEV